MEAPTLGRSPKGLLIKFTPPVDARGYPEHGKQAAIHVFRGAPTAGSKHFLAVKADGGNEGELLPPGQTGRTLNAQHGTAGVTIVGGLHADDQEYKATVCFRGAYDFGFGPESPLSAGITLSVPPKPCAPVLKPHGSDSNVEVSYAAPARCSGVCLKFVDGANEFLVADQPDGAYVKTLVPGMPDPPVALTGVSMSAITGQGKVYVKVPLKDVEYAVSVAAFNGFWSDFSAPTTIKIADHAPPQAAAPLVEMPTEDGVTVLYTLPPETERGKIVIIFSTAADGKKYYNNTTKLLVDNPPSFQDAVTTYNGVKIVKCLAAKTEYEVSVAAMNEYGIGWASPATKVKTLPSEVELLGTETQEDRDVELRKRAVDVENADPSPAKKGKSG